jgi:hypothetical protein
VSLSAPVDLYCERLGPGLWAEPLNAFSNIAFFIAAWLALRLARKAGGVGWRAGLLIALLFAIAIGSTLFHTLATGWAEIADTAPILLYEIAFIRLYARGVIGLPAPREAVLTGAFLACVVLAGMAPAGPLNGSVSYLPAFAFLAGLGVYHARAGRKMRWALLAAAGLFALSLAFRSLDMAVCAAFPYGLHYMWHLLNAAVLYLSFAAYARNRAG